MNVTTPADVPESVGARPAFETEQLDVDVERATELVCDTLEGLTATDTDEGITFRTTDGMLVAVLAGGRAEGAAAELHYRTEPASESATLKARRIRRALEPHAASSESRAQTP